MLVKQSINKPTRFVLPVSIFTKKGKMIINRYYDTEFELYKAYRQLKKIVGFMKPLYPVVYD